MRPSPGGVRLLGLCLAACALSWAAPSHAGDRLVRVTIAGEASEARGMEAVFAELLARLRVTVEITRSNALDPGAIAPPPTTTPELLALVWVDLTKSGAARLFLLDVGADRVLLRKVQRAPAGAELVQEELGHILQTSVEGLLEGEPVGVPRQEILPLLEAEPRASEPPRPDRPHAAASRAPRTPTAEAAPGSSSPRAAAGVRAHASLLYGAGLLGRDAPITQGPELAAFGHISGGLEPGLWLGIQWRLPIEVTEAPISARFSQLAPRALVTVKLSGDADRALRFGIGGGFDVVRVETTSEPSQDVRVRAPSTGYFALGRAALLFDWRVSGALRVASALTVDADGSDARYVFQSRAGERLLLEPYALRPALALGIATP